MRAGTQPDPYARACVTASQDQLDRDRMPRWVPRAIALFFVGLAIFSVAGWLLDRLSDLIVILLVSLFLSFAMEPGVNALAKRGWRRGPATGLVFFLFFIVFAVLIGTTGSLVVSEAQEFAQDSDTYLERIEDFIQEHFDEDFSLSRLQDDVQRPGGFIDQFSNRFAEGAISIGTTAIGVLFQLATIGLFTFYLVADGPRLRRALFSFLPPERQGFVLQAWEVAIEKTGGYVYSRGLLAVLSTLIHWAGFQLIGVPYSLALAVWVGLLSQFIPVIGTYIAGALPVVVALLNDPWSAVWTLAFVVIYQQIENYLFAPRVTARTMSLHPAVAFGAVIAGGALLGAVGALLALPAAAVLQAFGSIYLTRNEVNLESDLLVDRHVKTTTTVVESPSVPSSDPSSDPPDASERPDEGIS